MPNHGERTEDGTAPPSPTASPTPAPTWAHRDDLIPFSPRPGIGVQVVAGDRLMVCWIKIAPGTLLPVHDHPHEQLGVVLEGAIEVTVGGETRRLGPGAAYAVPPHVPHGGQTGAEGCLVLETFTPPREDYLARAAAAGNEPAGHG